MTHLSLSMKLPTPVHIIYIDLKESETDRSAHSSRYSRNCIELSFLFTMVKIELFEVDHVRVLAPPSSTSSHRDYHIDTNEFV